MRKKNGQSLKDVIQELFKTYQLNDKLNDAKIIASWEEIMGKTIAKHTKRIYINKGTLYLQISSASLKQDMFFAKPKIIKLINNALGSNHVQEIVFR